MPSVNHKAVVYYIRKRWYIGETWDEGTDTIIKLYEYQGRRDRLSIAGHHVRHGGCWLVLFGVRSYITIFTCCAVRQYIPNLSWSSLFGMPSKGEVEAVVYRILVSHHGHSNLDNTDYSKCISNGRNCRPIVQALALIFKGSDVTALLYCFDV